MDDARELFAKFRPSWWDIVSTRARNRTIGTWQMEVEPAFIAIAIFVVTTAIYFAIDRQAAKGTLMSSAIHGLAVAAVFLAWYVFNVVRSARDVHDEQQNKIGDLETAMARQLSQPLSADLREQVRLDDGKVSLTGLAPTVATGPPLEDRLIQFRIDGVKLRNEQINVSDLGQWKARVDKWEGAALSAISDGARVNRAFVARFVTLKDVKRVRFSWACNTDHNHQLEMLDQRIDLLLEILASL